LKIVLKYKGMTIQNATLGNGCFWCTEAVFSKLKGVQKVTPGFSGGHIKNPAYREVITGRTGHAEVLHIEFDTEEVGYEKLLEVFFATHDPTTLNRQGNDIGTQYRSVIFHHDSFQKGVAEKIITRLTQEKVFQNPIVTELTRFENIYPAEDYHHNYFELHQQEPYCSVVIQPKLQIFLKIYQKDLKTEF
jgi:peptide-methionine (S)-S-oxide reductase